jgi:hypothetical protein
VRNWQKHVLDNRFTTLFIVFLKIKKSCHQRSETLAEARLTVHLEVNRCKPLGVLLPNGFASAVDFCSVLVLLEVQKKMKKKMCWTVLVNFFSFFCSIFNRKGCSKRILFLTTVLLQLFSLLFYSHVTTNFLTWFDFFLYYQRIGKRMF